MGVKVQVGKSIPGNTHRYPEFSVTLYPFICRIIEGEIVLHEHAAIEWLSPHELHALDWAEADLPVIEAYCAESVNNPWFHADEQVES